VLLSRTDALALLPAADNYDLPALRAACVAALGRSREGDTASNTTDNTDGRLPRAAKMASN
jgi:hypothetical protein